VGKRSRHAHAISPELQRILDWYFEQKDDPSIRSILLDTGPHQCPYCEVEIGAVHKVGCPMAGKLFAGCVRRRSRGDEPAEAIMARRMAAVGTALGRLEERERDAVEVAWTFRRQADWWRSETTNRGRIERRTSKALPEYAAARASKREVAALARHYRQEWDRTKRKPMCKTALEKLEGERRRGAIW